MKYRRTHIEPDWTIGIHIFRWAGPQAWIIELELGHVVHMWYQTKAHDYLFGPIEVNT